MIDSAGVKLLARHQHRKLELQGCCNIRDLGGLPTSSGGQTRAGVLFRSDALASLTAEDSTLLGGLGIRRIYDLRTEEERRKYPNQPLPGAPVQHAAGFLPRGNREMIDDINAGRSGAADARAAMCIQYERLMLDHTPLLCGVYRALLTPGGTPAILHCASGKDRTGISVALLLKMVGVAGEQITDDYVISHYQRRAVDLFGGSAPDDAVEQIMSARSEYLAAGFAAIDRAYGSFDSFIERGLGLTSGERAALTELLVV